MPTKKVQNKIKKTVIKKNVKKVIKKDQSVALQVIESNKSGRCEMCTLITNRMLEGTKIFLCGDCCERRFLAKQLKSQAK